ncbi:MAG TPA: response regulator [Polyangia bacterium]|jgi:two-component system chemotaxis response regulator CheY|nr:response regulator [Polyangia bacterium]
MRALIVDDSRTMRRIVGKVVRENGFDTVLEAGNGQEALNHLRECRDAPFALALVDWNMPVMDGLSFVQAARAEGFSELPIIMITTEGSLEYVTRAMEAGANEYLMKPFTKESLHDKLVLLGFETTT